MKNPAILFYILDKKYSVEEGLRWQENSAHSTQLCNRQEDGPSVVKEGTLIPFGTVQNALTDLCVNGKSD